MSPYRRRTPTVVMTGIAGRFGRLLARELRTDHRIIGIDPRGSATLPRDVKVHRIDIRRRKAEDVFRTNRVDAVIHLSPTASWRGGAREHRDIAVMGARRMLSYCEKYDVPKLIVLSSAAVYGAAPGNNQFLTEDSPLLGGHNFPALRDLVEVDMYATSFFWRHPEVDTVVLRPAHVIGRLGNVQSRYLSQRFVPTLLGYDPMMQVMAPADLIQAIIAALKPGIRGVFNVSGAPPAPLSAIIRAIGNTPLPVPEPIARAMIGVAFGMGVADVPAAQLDYLKYVCMGDDEYARKTLRYEPKIGFFDTLSTLSR